MGSDDRPGPVPANEARAQLERLLGLTSRLSEPLLAEEVARVVVDEAQAAMGALTALMWTVDDPPTHATLVRAVGHSPGVLERYARIPLEPWLPMGDAMLRREPLFFESRAEFRRRYEAAEKHVTGQEPYRELSYTCLPFVVHGRAIAGVSLIFPGGRQFDEQERLFLTLLAHHAAQALERARLFEREKKTHQQLASLRQLAAALSSAATVEAVAALATRAGVEALGLVSAGLWTTDDQGDLALCGEYGMSDENRSVFQRIPSDSPLPAARIARERRPHWCESARDLESEHPSVAAGLGRDAVQAYAALPLVREDRVLGVLAFGADRPRHFPPEERGFMSTVAEHCADAIARAHLYDDARRAKCRLESVLERMPIGVLVSRPPDSTLVFANDAYARIWRLDAVPVRGEERCRMMNATYPDGRPIPMAESPVVRALHGEVVEAIEARIERQDGTTGWVQISAAPVLRDDGSVDVAVATAIDVTAEKEARADVDEAARAKDAFLAMLSHELRNPLAPILGSLEVLDSVDPGSDDARKAMAIIQRQVDHLTHIVDDLLDVTRISRGKISLKNEHLELSGLVHRTIDDHRAQLEAAGITLTHDLGAAELWVDADATRVVQVVGNLLVNAAKFTPHGGRVEVTLRGEGAMAVLSVRDNGVGISRDMLHRLFEPFVQAPQTLDRTRGGLGLGLAMAAGLVGLHGGSIHAESAGLGEGSEFVVRLPLVAAPSRAAPPSEKKVAMTGRRVLIVEDHEDAAEMMRMLLTLEGHEVVVAHDGGAGIALARSFCPEVVFCDLGLPDIDGYAVARAIRAEASLGQVFLCALSGYTRSEDRTRAAEAGFDAHLAKPTNMEDLQRVFAAASSRAAG